MLPAPLTRFEAAIIGRNITVNIAKAKAELGYAPVLSVDEGMAELAASA